MEQLNSTVNTDPVCNINSKETNYDKKVGSPTLVSTKCNLFINLKEVIKSKKVGPSTLVNIVIIVSVISALFNPMSPCRTSSPPPSALCPTTPAWQWPLPTWSAVTTDTQRSGAHWSYCGIRSNTLIKMVNGNKRLGYNLGIWNCRKGLLNSDKEKSTKMVDVENLMKSKKLHMLCLVESDLHGEVSRYRRAQPLTTKHIHEQLAIPGYKLYLPPSWNKHGQARMIVYAKEELQVKV